MSERHPDAGTMSMAMAQPIQGQKLFGRLEPLSVAMLLCVGCVCFIILAHLAVILWLSVIEGSPGAAVHSYSWKNYLEVLTDGRTVDVLINTFGFSVVSLVVALLFGLPAAWLVERTDLRGKTLLYTLMTIGMLIPGFAAAMGWLFLMHPRIGLLNVWAKQLFGLDNSPFDIASVVGMGWVQGLNLAPLGLHHDGCGIPCHGSSSGRGGTNQPGQLAAHHVARDPTAGMAGHHGSLDLYFHHRFRRL